MAGVPHKGEGGGGFRHTGRRQSRAGTPAYFCVPYGTHLLVLGRADLHLPVAGSPLQKTATTRTSSNSDTVKMEFESSADLVPGP